MVPILVPQQNQFELFLQFIIRKKKINSIQWLYYLWQ